MRFNIGEYGVKILNLNHLNVKFPSFPRSYVPYGLSNIAKVPSHQVSSFSANTLREMLNFSEFTIECRKMWVWITSTLLVGAIEFTVGQAQTLPR